MPFLHHDYARRARFNYIDAEGEFTFIYMMKECFVWVGNTRHYIAINNLPEVLMTHLKKFFSHLYHAYITNIKITNELLKQVFPSNNTKRITRHNPNPPENQLEKVTFADPKLSEKKEYIPAGYENYDVTNTQYIEEIDDTTTGTLGINCDKGKLYLSKSLTSSQFRAWSTRRINEIINYFENSVEVSLDTISGLNMFSSDNWEGSRKQEILILNEIAYALISCKKSNVESYPISKTPYEIFAQAGRFFCEKVSFVCDSCEEKVIPVCDKCGSSQFCISKKPPVKIICCNCGNTQTNEFTFACESGHLSIFHEYDDVLELIATYSFSKKLFETIHNYFPDISFQENEFFTISKSGLTLHQSPSYAKLKPSDIADFERISKRNLINSYDQLSAFLPSLKEKCNRHPTNEMCLSCKNKPCNNTEEIGCLLKLFSIFEGYSPKPHQGHEFGDVSMLVSLDGKNYTFLGLAKSGKEKITAASQKGREILHQVLCALIDARAEVTGVIYTGILDDQLTQLLYQEAKVHNKRLVIMDHEFMIKLLDAFISDHGITLY